MLLQIIFANKFSISNYYKQGSIYTNTLELKSISIKKGVAIDTLKLALPKELFDSISESFVYLCYSTPVQILIDDKLIMTGYLEKIDINTQNIVSFDITSSMKEILSIDAAPRVAGLCQNQVYSEYCGLDATKYAYHFTDVHIDLFSGYASISIDKINNTISLGGSPVAPAALYADGNTKLFDGNQTLVTTEKKVNNPIFLNKDMWWNAFVVINDTYKTTVINVTDDKIFFALNYINESIVADTVSVYLKCDKTYGQCFSRFNNVNNFWGFANTGRQVQTFDIFSAENLTYCGEDQANQDFEDCPSDFNLFGVNFNE